MRYKEMDSATIAQQVRSFIVENYFLGQDYRFADGDSFLNHGIIDSTGVLELVAFLQDTYGITVDDEELTPENLDSSNNVATYLLRKFERTAQADDPAVREGILRGNA